MADQDLTNVVSTRKGLEILKSSPMTKGITAKGVACVSSLVTVLVRITFCISLAGTVGRVAIL